METSSIYYASVRALLHYPESVLKNDSLAANHFWPQSSAT